jgi:ParB/RepB/Spo0J family partition protein
MTTGSFLTVSLDSITIERESRQRRELVGLDELAQSIRDNGLIHPPLVTPDLVLIAGERRVTACRDILGWTALPVQLTEDLSTVRLRALELEENVKRVDLTWKDQCLAVAEYHELNRECDDDWHLDDTAEALGVSRTEVSRKSAVARELIAGNPMVCNADKLSVAYNIVERQVARRASAESDKLTTMLAPAKPTSGDGAVPTEAPEEPHTPPPPAAPFFHQDFLTYEFSRPANFLHCDFPYGVNANKHNSGAAKSFGGYDDSEDVYWTLISALGDFVQLGGVASSAHMMFWFSMDYYQRTVDTLSAQGWRVNPFPLVWYKSDNSGILPDPRRGPRRNYETALLCSLGDRPVVQAVSNVFAGPNTKHIHMSEKPIPMLRHFFRMFVDETTVMLDPTMGSGNAVVAAELMGAASAIGLERDETFWRQACDAYAAGAYATGG